MVRLSEALHHTSPSYRDSACGHYKLGITKSMCSAAYLNDRRILLAPLHKLIKRQLRILVAIHVSEDFLHPLNITNIPSSAT